MKNVDDELLTIDQAAEMLGLKKSYMYLLRHKGKGPRSHIHGGKVRYLRGDVERYIEWQRDATTRGGEQ